MAGTSAGLQLFTYLTSLFVKPLQVAFGWSRGQIAAASGALLVCALFMPVAGFLADRKGVRPLAALGVGAFVVSYLALGSMTGARWQYFAILGLIACVGGPCTNYFLFARPVVGAFRRARGLALSVSLCGVPVASLVVLPILQQIIQAQGWRAGYYALAGLSLVLGGAALVLLGRSEPALEAAPGHQPATGMTFGQTLGDRRLWWLVAAAAGVCIPTGFYVSSLQPMLSDKGLSGGQAALLGSWYALAAIAGRLGVGGLLDRFPPTLVGAATLGAPALALIIFIAAPAGSPAAFAVAIGLFAVANGAEADVVCFLGARYFGLAPNGRVNGLLGGVSAVAIAVGGMMSGIVFDRFGSYDIAMAVAAATAALAALAVLASGAGAAARRRLAEGDGGEPHFETQ